MIQDKIDSDCCCVLVVERCNFSIGSGDSSPIAEAVDGSRPGSNSSVSSRDSLNMADEEREETEGSEGDEPAIKMRALAIDDYEEELDEHRGMLVIGHDLMFSPILTATITFLSKNAISVF